MYPEKVVFGFFILPAATLGFGFLPGEIDDPLHHVVYAPAVALVRPPFAGRGTARDKDLRQSEAARIRARRRRAPGRHDLARRRQGNTP